MSNLHIPVLLNETLNVLNVRPDGIYVDCTAGRGGHSAEIIKRIKTGKLVCIDNDADSIAYIKEKFKNENRVIIVKDNFANLSRILQTLRITKVDGILLDLGASSPMYDNLGRGFSYHHDAKLDMRFDQTQKVDALYVINNYTAAQLNTIFINFGEIKFPYRTTKAIIAARTEKPITTTKELVDLIKKNLA
jgi:16S rRNA (cytosine1402-N4)-methyltransferase